MKYQVYYTGGDGKDYDEGIWEVRKTPKRTTVEKIKKGGAFDNFKVGQKFRIGKGTGNPTAYEFTDEFVVYFNQAGIPYTFNPLTHKDI